jgi:hypothetical protein
MTKQIITITLEDIPQHGQIRLKCSLHIDAVHSSGSLSEIVATAFEFHHRHIMDQCIDIADDIIRLNQKPL